MKRLLLIALVLALACGCAKSSAIRDASLDELGAAYGKPGTILIDLRPGNALQGDMKFLKEAMHQPLSSLVSNLDRVPKDSNVYLLANDANDVTKAANMLADSGYKFVYRVTGSFDEYAAKFPDQLQQ